MLDWLPKEFFIVGPHLRRTNDEFNGLVRSGTLHSPRIIMQKKKVIVISGNWRALNTFGFWVLWHLKEQWINHFNWNKLPLHCASLNWLLFCLYILALLCGQSGRTWPTTLVTLWIRAAFPPILIYIIILKLMHDKINYCRIGCILNMTFFKGKSYI